MVKEGWMVHYTSRDTLVSNHRHLNMEVQLLRALFCAFLNQNENEIDTYKEFLKGRMLNVLSYKLVER